MMEDKINKEEMANIHFMAAAPVLLAACENAAAGFAHALKFFNWASLPNLQAAYEEVAIAKAKGEGL